MTEIKTDPALTKIIFDQESKIRQAEDYRKAANEVIPPEVAAGQELDDAARALTSDPARAAVALRNAGHLVVALDGRGEPISRPLDTPGVVRWWSDRPHQWPGVPASDHLVVLALDDDGWQWLAEVAMPPKPADRKAPWNRRYHFGAIVILGEPLNRPTHRIKAIPLPMNATDQQAAEIARGPVGKTARWLVWSGWPAGWKPPKKLHGPAELRPALPVDSAILEWQGRTWRVANFPHFWQPMPEWLASELGAKP